MPHHPEIMFAKQTYIKSAQAINKITGHARPSSEQAKTSVSQVKKKRKKKKRVMALTYSVIAYIVTKTFSATIDTNAHIRFLLLRFPALLPLFKKMH